MQKFILVLINFIITLHSFDYQKPIPGYFSQKGQDKFLNEEIFKNKQGGIFIEVGAHDGISFSNTYFFEKNLGWSGICIEPNPDIFDKLKKNRTCYCEQVCISDTIGQKKFLKCSGYMLEMYSGLFDNFDPRHLDRINNEIITYGGTTEIIWINCTTLKDLFLKYNILNIDLLSIDIEGGEKSAIKMIDFDQVTIDVIIIENNFNEKEVCDFLLSKGYDFLKKIGKDDIYRRRAL